MITCVPVIELKAGKLYRLHKYPNEPFIKFIKRMETGSSDGCIMLEFEGRHFVYTYPPFDLLFDCLLEKWKDRIEE